MTGLGSTLRAEQVEVGTQLPELVLELTPTFIVSTAIATRDFQDVHHDRDAAQAQGTKDIFMNILTTMGIVQRYVTDWAGPEAIVRDNAVQLGVPSFANDTMTMSGRVTGCSDGSGGPVFEIDVRGTNSLGEHVAATVKVALPEGDCR